MSAPATRLRIVDATVVTMTDAGVLERATVTIEGSRIVRIEPDGGATPLRDIDGETEVLDAAGRVLIPGFVDAHTHALWAGDRLGEFEERAGGATYQEILAAGGGIMSTVRAVRAASERELARLLAGRLDVMLAHGSTTIEVKSGYGLTVEDELKSLRAIRAAAEGFGGTVVPTALLAHALDPDRADFVGYTIDEVLPAVASEFGALSVDAYCEEGAWSLDACARFFRRAAGMGHLCRVHADQFNRLGMVEWAVGEGFRSVDHLEATDRATLELLARSETFAVMLPGCGFHLDGRHADGRAFLDSPGGQGRLVIASNFNPGSSPTPSMPMIIALAVRRLGLTVEEALRAATLTPARLLGFDDRGMLAPGARADCVLLRHQDVRMLGFEFGANPVDEVVCGGRWVR